MRDHFHISELCAALSVSKSGYRAARKPYSSEREQHNQQLLQQIKSIHSFIATPGATAVPE